VYRFVDRTRTAHFRNGAVEPRRLLTYVRIPQEPGRRLPVIVFAHGFRSTPGVYAALLDAWAQAGYLVAAPIFPGENPQAAGGADENDLVNEPGDISFVISKLLRTPALASVVDPDRIAVAGQSDGAIAAFAVAYDSRLRDPRVRAAVVLSGAELDGQPSRFDPGSPPLLATQGTHDPVNPPSASYRLFHAAAAPKFLLRLLGAGHRAPYSTDRRELLVVERVTIAFLDHYLKGAPLAPLLAAGDDASLARLTADP
jgi:dienelactone hydrolase